MMQNPGNFHVATGKTSKMVFPIREVYTNEHFFLKQRKLLKYKWMLPDVSLVIKFFRNFKEFQG